MQRNPHISLNVMPDEELESEQSRADGHHRLYHRHGRDPE